MPEVRELCQRLVPGEIPDVLSVEAPSWAKLNDCIGNTKRMVTRRGGGVDYGWQLWETFRGVMIEAEFHAVWVDERGRRHDVTPKPLPSIRETVFLADPNLVYNGRQIDNIRVALIDDQIVHDFIAASEAFFETTNRGELADFHGELTLTPEMQAIRMRCRKLEVAINAKYFA